MTSAPISIAPDNPFTVQDVEPLFALDGPFASLYLPADSETFESSERLAIHTSNATKGLEDSGFGGEAIEAIEEEVRRLGHDGGATLVVIATPAGVALSGHLADPYEFSASVDSLPDIIPIIDSTRRSIPHVIVVADRTGGDVFTVDAEGSTEHETVEGDTEHIQRSAPGGWSQRRFQQRAENTWEANADLVAQEAVEAADEIGAELIVIAGDVRAVGFFRDSLPERFSDAVVEVEGSRAVDGDLSELAGRITDAVATRVASIRADKLESLADGRGTDSAVAALDDVLAALRRGAVDTLYVIADKDDDSDNLAYSRSNPMIVARTAMDLEGVVDADDVDYGPHRAVLVRAAVQEDASVVVTPRTPAFSGESVAATLRFPLH